ncbi:MAG: terpene cyclase/mutase family protein [Pirellulales bacterium]|nr:terpene cyclase/mutase family protein [Pirellulales bacterium]
MNNSRYGELLLVGATAGLSSSVFPEKRHSALLGKPAVAPISKLALRTCFEIGSTFWQILAWMLTLTLVVLCICCQLSLADEPKSPEQTAAEVLTPEVGKAIERGLTVLASRQHDDGSFGSGNFRGNVAVTALAGMAMMSAGSTPGRGPYGSQISKSMDYLLSCSQKSGLIVAHGATSRGPMYGHGFATLFLAECYGMSHRAELREKLVAAVKLIVDTQNSQGGWRYQPVRENADISVTICQIMALRAARNAGIYVPKETVDKCIDYVKRSQNPDGGFIYILGGGGPSAFPRSAAGIVALYSAGIYEGPEINKGIAYLMKFLPNKDAAGQTGYYYYGQYYAVQAMWHAGGEHWKKWYPAVSKDMISRQSRDGSWQSAYSSDYATAMACIVLQMPNGTLPIFQR